MRTHPPLGAFTAHSRVKQVEASRYLQRAAFGTGFGTVLAASSSSAFGWGARCLGNSETVWEVSCSLTVCRVQQQSERSGTYSRERKSLPSDPRPARSRISARIKNANDDRAGARCDERQRCASPAPQRRAWSTNDSRARAAQLASQLLSACGPLRLLQQRVVHAAVHSRQQPLHAWRTHLLLHGRRRRQRRVHLLCLRHADRARALARRPGRVLRGPFLRRLATVWQRVVRAARRPHRPAHGRADARRLCRAHPPRARRERRVGRAARVVRRLPGGHARGAAAAAPPFARRCCVGVERAAPGVRGHRCVAVRVECADHLQLRVPRWRGVCRRRARRLRCAAGRAGRGGGELRGHVRGRVRSARAEHTISRSCSRPSAD